MTLSCDSSVIINPEGVSLIRLSKFCRLSEGVGIFIAKFVVKLIHKAQAKR